jgi:N-acetylglucosaminyldiphosphoundecaprenol N-acetyl-beta-D-mannosaminyltransferase
MSAPRKQEVLGVGISVTSYSEVTRTCAEWLHQKAVPSKYICVTSVHGLMEARKDPAVKAILNDADIATPDGMPLVWALRSFGIREQQRVYGPNLMLALCEQAEQLGHRIFLYGGRPDTLETLCLNLQQRHPRLQIAGSYSPPFRALTDAEEDEIQNMIRDAAPDLLFVGISTPKQERWMSAHRETLPGVIMVGVGAAFDFHAGRVRQAPSWMQSRGLEWLFRLVSEPARLWKRYVLVTPWFLPYWALQKASIALHDIACGRSEAGTAIQPARRGH